MSKIKATLVAPYLNESRTVITCQRVSMSKYKPAMASLDETRARADTHTHTHGKKNSTLEVGVLF